MRLRVNKPCMILYVFNFKRFVLRVFAMMTRYYKVGGCRSCVFFFYPSQYARGINYIFLLIA